MASVRELGPMRAALFVLLVACGSRDNPASESASEPASEPAPASESESESESASESASESESESESAAPSLPLDDGVPEGGPFPAGQALVMGDRLLVLEADYRTLRFVTLPLGRTDFRTRFVDEPRGGIDLHAFGEDRALVHAGNELHVFDLVSGRRIARHEGPMNGVGRHRASFESAHGACAIHTFCALTLVSCEDAHPIGARIEGSIVRRYPRRDGRLSTYHTTNCEGPVPALIGRAGDTALVVGRYDPARSPGTPPSTTTGAVTIAIDLGTGEDRWASTEATATRPRHDASGVSDDGRTCFVTGTDDELVVFDCADGRVRFRTPSVKEAAWQGTSLLVTDRRNRRSVVDPTSGVVVARPPAPRAAPERAAPTARFDIERGAPTRVLLGRRELARFEHDAWLVAEHVAGERSTLVIYASRPEAPGAVHLVRLE